MRSCVDSRSRLTRDGVVTVAITRRGPDPFDKMHFAARHAPCPRVRRAVDTGKEGGRMDATTRCNAFVVRRQHA